MIDLPRSSPSPGAQHSDFACPYFFRVSAERGTKVRDSPVEVIARVDICFLYVVEIHDYGIHTIAAGICPEDHHGLRCYGSGAVLVKAKANSCRIADTLESESGAGNCHGVDMTSLLFVHRVFGSPCSFLLALLSALSPLGLLCRFHCCIWIPVRTCHCRGGGV